MRGLSGVAIGSGWQDVVAYVNLVCYYIIGFPVGCLLGFKASMGVAVSSLAPPLIPYSCYFVRNADGT